MVTGRIRLQCGHRILSLALHCCPTLTPLWFLTPQPLQWFSSSGGMLNADVDEGCDCDLALQFNVRLLH